MSNQYGKRARLEKHFRARKRFWFNFGVVSILIGFASMFDGGRHLQHYRGGNSFTAVTILIGAVAILATVLIKPRKPN